MRKVLNVLAVLALGGCTYLPIDGPTHRSIETGASASLLKERDSIVADYVLVDVTQDVVSVIPEIGPRSFFRSFGSDRSPPPTYKVAPGDVLQLTIYESAAGGLFTPNDPSQKSGNSVVLPAQTVERKGTIVVPYAGDITVVGRTTEQIREDIQKKLSKRAVEPQVLVTLNEQLASTVNVIGETASKVQVRPNDRILDIVARHGGTRYPVAETFVTLLRRGHSATIYFPVLVRDDKENVFVHPGDTVYIYQEAQSFAAFGALGSGTQTQGVTGFFPFGKEKLSLNEAIAKAGGLLDDRASAQAFVYRLELRSVLEELHVDLSKFDPKLDPIPTIYRVNYRDPAVFFVAERFSMRHRDALYVANADSVEIEKFLSHTRAISSTAAGVSSDAVTARNAWRALVRD